MATRTRVLSGETSLLLTGLVSAVMGFFLVRSCSVCSLVVTSTLRPALRALPGFHRAAGRDIELGTVDLPQSEVVAVLIQGSLDPSTARETHLFVRKGGAGLTCRHSDIPAGQVTGKSQTHQGRVWWRHQLPAPRWTSFSDTSNAVTFRPRAISRWKCWHRPGHLDDSGPSSGSRLGMWPRPRDPGPRDWLEDGM